MNSGRPVTIRLSSFFVLFIISSTILPTQQSDTSDDSDDDIGSSKDLQFMNLRTSLESEDRLYKNRRNFPSTLCPRDTFQASIQGYKCLRKCLSDEDCKSRKKKCRCDSVCGMSCIKPDRECPKLNNINNGFARLNGVIFGSKANYTCMKGFVLVGHGIRTCKSDGKWSGREPTCKNDTLYCSMPSKYHNSRFNVLGEQTTFEIGSVVEYFCNQGFLTTGSSQAKCLMIEGSASWYGPDMTCEPINCGSPRDIAHGWHAGECYKYGCVISYHCIDGYELIGRTEKFCTADGVWLPKADPECIKATFIECDPPDDLVNGKATYTSYAYNSIVSYECRSGFTIVGISTRRCAANRKWTGELPTCKEINCGFPGNLYNGWIENIENGTGLGTSLIFRCKDHMKLEGHTSSLCQTDGKWRYALPQCLSPCVIPDINFGQVYVLGNTTNTIDDSNVASIAEHGKVLQVDCIKNYEFGLSNNSTATCVNGTWSPMPSCKPARCKAMPKYPKNGIVIVPKSDHGMKAIYKCKDGFELVGTAARNFSSYVRCEYGNWVGNVPSCMEMFCPFPGYVPNGKVLLVGNMGVYDYRSYVRKVVNNKQIMYDCDKGYYLSAGPPGATCVAGSWSPKEMPKCSLGEHPRMRFNRRRRSIKSVADAFRFFNTKFSRYRSKLSNFMFKSLSPRKN